jgi:hypothetical protein
MSAARWLKENGGMLDGIKHVRLIAELDKYASDARIPPEWVWRPMPAGVTEEEREWMRNYRRNRANGVYGMLVTGESDLDPTSRMGAIAGRLTRNFIRARVFGIEQVFDSMGDFADPIIATCLLVPDFVSSDDKKEPSWRVKKLSSLLLDRWQAGGLTQTVLYAPDIESVSMVYGSHIATLIKNHYTQVAL